MRSPTETVRGGDGEAAHSAFASANRSPIRGVSSRRNEKSESRLTSIFSPRLGGLATFRDAFGEAIELGGCRTCASSASIVAGRGARLRTLLVVRLATVPKLRYYVLDTSPPRR